MRWMCVLAAASGCAAADGPESNPARSAPGGLDEAAAVARAHEFFDAVDGRDRARFRALIGAGFVLFEHGRSFAADELSRSWAHRNRSSAPRRTRTCTQEKVHRSRHALVYIGDCEEQDAGRAGAPAQGWNTVVLVPEGGAWKVALWQWQVSGLAAERAMWNDQYRRGVGFRKEPNRLLVRTVEGVAPGKALDLAMGQGRNALYLASRGWKVTGVDISDEGIRQARAAAAERNLALDAVLSDVNDHDFGTARWDLVTMIYAGADTGWIERAKVSLKPGGLFVFENFLRDPKKPVGGGIGIEAGKLAPMFAGWEILEDEVVEDIGDWSKEKNRLVRFVARRRQDRTR